MKITKTEKLEWLASEAGKTTEEFSQQLIAELISHEIIEDILEVCGSRIDPDWMDRFGEKTIPELCAIFHNVGIEVVRYVHIEALLGLRFMGEGDCPICGATMEVVSFEERCIGGDGYTTPYEYETLWEDKICPCCGYNAVGDHGDDD